MNLSKIIVILLLAGFLSACSSQERLPTPEPVDRSAPQVDEEGRPMPQAGGENRSSNDSRGDAEIGVGEEFVLWEGDSVSVDGERFEIRLDAVVNDSRCPQGVQCFWEGNVRVQVSVGDEAYTLTLGKLLEGDQNSVALGEGVILRVVAVAPYPGSAQEGQPYRVTLIVERETSQPYNYPANV